MSDPQTESGDRRRLLLGRWGEELAAAHLESAGYRILARNWRTRRGEVDIIAEDGEVIAFVEVKTRKGRAYGLPEEALTRRKADRLQNLAQQYMMEHELHDHDWRIDLVAVELDSQGMLLRCEHVPNAVLGW